jgi:hypothetical protein
MTIAATNIRVDETATATKSRISIMCDCRTPTTRRLSNFEQRQLYFGGCNPVACFEERPFPI